MSQLSRFFATSGPGSNVESLTGNIGGAVFSTAGNINVIGDGIQTFVTGNPGTSTLTITLIGSGVVKTLTGNTGGPISPTAGNINIVTANSIPLLAGAASTLTLDFALTDNLLLGSSGSITTGNTNVGYGKLAAASISSGSSNSFIGYESGALYTTGSNSTAVGAFSMLNAVAGASNNTAIGYASLSNLAGAGTNIVAVGVNAGTNYTTTETNNIIVGSFTGAATEQETIRIGSDAGAGFPFGNTFIGFKSGNNTLTIGTSFDNIGIGFQTLNLLTTGARNIAIGGSNLRSVNSGINNIAIGQGSSLGISTGFGNIVMGVGSLAGLTTGGSNIIIGGNGSGGAYLGAESNNIIIGTNSGGVLGESNVLRIGQSASVGVAVTNTYIAGINGVNVGSVASVVSISGDHLGSTTITAGTNISVTPGANTITIAGTGAAGFVWTVETVNLTMVVNHGYIANKAGTLALALPATAAIGDVIRVTGINTATGWQITQAANQQIFFGTTQTTLGATGTLTSSAIRDSIEIVCVVAGASTVWNVISSIGNITVV